MTRTDSIVYSFSSLNQMPLLIDAKKLSFSRLYQVLAIPMANFGAD